MDTGKRLKETRKILNLTQEELGNVLGLTWHKIKDIEANKLKLTPIIAETIEEKYSISGWWLLTGKGEMSISNVINLDYKAEIIDTLNHLNDTQLKYIYHITEAEKLKS